MSLLHFFRLLIKNWLILFLVPFVMAASVYYFTRHEKKTYSSESVIYTGIASGYSLNGSNRADFYATSNAFDNLLTIINSRETKQEVAIRLLAEHLILKECDPDVLSWDSFQELAKTIPDSIRRKLVRTSVGATIGAINKYMQSSDNNAIYKLLYSNDPFYSINALNGITAMRINSSDLIKISYSTEDAVICKRTLELLEETFMRKHKLLREGQTESVIAYFEQETQKAYETLDDAEQDFLQFNKGNDIINYYEQTKAVAGEKEHLYALDHTLQMERTASAKALEKLNHNLDNRAQYSVFGSRILGQRDELSDLYNKIAVYETMSDKPGTDTRPILDSLKNKTATIERSMKNTLDHYYDQATSPEGLPSKDILDEWLRNTIAYEQGKARLTVMDKRKREFETEYQKFAPLGAMLKKIERKISVAEQAYLEMLHGLNLARLTQQNNELTSKLTIVDPPYLPLKPNTSKRIILIIVAFMGGFVVVLATLLTQALLNKTVQEPTKASKSLGMPILGVYPIIEQSKMLAAKANLRLLQQVLATLGPIHPPLNIGFISVQEKEGKTELIHVLQEGFNSLQLESRQVQWTGAASAEKLSQSAINFIELPPLDNYVYTAQSLPPMSHVFVALRANRIWSRIDKDLVNNFIKATGTTPQVILNGVEVDFAESFIGEAPKRRNFIRSFFKRQMRFEFGNQKTLVIRKKEMKKQ